MTSNRADAVRRAADAVLIALFVSALAWVLTATALVPRATYDGEEKRLLASFPGLTPLSRFPSGFDRFFNDHFGGRQALIRTHHLVMVRALRVSPTPRVLLGKDSWLFYGTDDAVDSYRRTRPMDASEKAAWNRNLSAKRDWLAAQGTDYLFVVAPNKSSIYPERMPESIRRLPEPSRLDQLVATVPSVLDLREALMPAKPDGQLYFRTDTHWNPLGAAIAAEAIRNAVGERHGAVAARSSPLKRPPVTRSGGDLAQMLRLRDWYSEASQDVVPAVTSRARLVRRILEVTRDYESADAASLPSALVFHDSFGDALMPFLAEQFSRVRFVRGRFDPDIVQEYRPDIVIEEICERYLTDAPPALTRELPSTPGAGELGLTTRRRH